MKKCGIYSITCQANGKIYIGSSAYIQKRWSYHRCQLRLNSHANPHLQSAWNLYGEAQFQFQVLELCDVSVLQTKEEYYIKQYNSIDPSAGFNLTLVGERLVFSDESRKRMSDSQRGKRLSEETKIKIGKAGIGRKPTDETRRKISVAKQNVSQETRDKLRIANSGKKHSEATKEKLRTFNTGRKLSPETRAKMSASRMGRIVSEETRRKISNTEKATKAKRKEAENVGG